MQPGPTSIGELLSNAFRMYRREPGLFILLTAITVIPVGILSAIASNSVSDAETTGRAVAILLTAVVPAILLLPISGAAISVATVRRLLGDRVGAGASLEPVGAHFWSLIGALVLATLGVTVGLFALIIPGIFLAVFWLFASQAVVIEGKGVRDALRRSGEIVRGSWWTVFLAYLVISIVAALARFVLELIGGAAFLALDGSGRTVAVAIWSTLVLLVVEPFLLIAVALLYADRVVRTDGRLEVTG
ncbi:MAG: hypothetical protein EBU54_17620 [Mycobacteriaceae bacterium]|nr:hypothetical protein [Mycobacteriaceae bacterium]